MTTEEKLALLDEAIREALDGLTGWSFSSATDAEKVDRATRTLNAALQDTAKGLP